jgi:hypothetical protein
MGGKIVGGVCLFFLVFILWTFTMIPVLMYAEKKCLDQGYPVTHVAYDYSIYCSTLDGAVTVRVDRQK